MYKCFYQRLFWLQIAQVFSTDLLMWHVKQIDIHYLMFFFLPYCYMQICYICKNIFPVSVNFGISWFFDKLCYDCCHLTTNVLQKNMILFNNMIHLPEAISCLFTDCTCRDSLYLQKLQYLHDSYEFFEACYWC